MFAIMIKKAVFKIFSLLVLSVFIFIKVVNVHSYDHFSGDDTAVENCSICEYQLHSDHDFLPAPYLETPTITHFIFSERKIITTLQSEIKSKFLLGQHYNRPPPGLI